MWGKRSTEKTCVEEVLKIVNRETEIYPLGALKGAMQSTEIESDLTETAVAFDANILLKINGHRRSEDIIDYLRTVFRGHLILPAQVIQEFWNNQYTAVDTLSGKIKKKSEELELEIVKIDKTFGEFSERFSSLIDEFRTSYGYVFDSDTLKKANLFIDLLSEIALIPTFPRSGLYETAISRKRAKTPPGFKDDLDGDFYVWMDLLFGLMKLKQRRKKISHVVLVSNDKKIDWVQNGVPHPILTAEIKALMGASFEIWNLDTLTKKLLG